MSRRGTTPTHIFKSNADLETVSELFVTYKQDGIRIEKTLSDVELETEDEMTTIKVTLSQEDTLGLRASGYVNIQVRAKYPDGKAIASNIVEAPVKSILKEGII